MKTIRKANEQRKKYYQGKGETPKRYKGTQFDRVLTYTNNHVGDCLKSAEIRKHAGVGSSRLCYIMDSMVVAGAARRIKRGVYAIDAVVPEFVTSCILETSNRGHGYTSYSNGKFTNYIQSPQWKVGEPNPWIEWYGFNEKSEPAKEENIKWPTYNKDTIDKLNDISIQSGTVKKVYENSNLHVTEDGNGIRVESDENVFKFSTEEFKNLSSYILDLYHPKTEDLGIPQNARMVSNTGVNIELKAVPGQVIFYIEYNKVCSAPVIKVNFKWTKSGQEISYETCHGKIANQRVFASKESLIKSL